MFISPEFVLYVVLIKLSIGSVIGLIVVGILYRSRFNCWLAIRGALLGAVAFLLVSLTAGWAQSHAAFQNGRRMPIAPWLEDLRLRNFIADNELVLCVAGSSIAALLAGIRFRGKART